MRSLLMSEQQMRQFRTLMSPSWRSFGVFYLFDSVRAAPPDPTGEAVAVRGDNLPWECGEHPALGQRHNDKSQLISKIGDRISKNPRSRDLDTIHLGPLLHTQPCHHPYNHAQLPAGGIAQMRGLYVNCQHHHTSLQLIP